MGNRNLALGALSAILCAIVTLEIVLLGDQRSPPPLAAAPALAAPSAVSGAELTTAYIQQALARPLFTEGRRPATRAAVAATVAQAQTGDLPRLSGILMAGRDRRAIFEGVDKPIVAVVGSQIGAYRITAIGPLRVTLQGPGGVQAVSLKYGAAAGASAPAVSTLDRLNSGERTPAAMPRTPTFEEMMATLPKTLPPMLNGLPQNDTRPAR